MRGSGEYTVGACVVTVAVVIAVVVTVAWLDDDAEEDDVDDCELEGLGEIVDTLPGSVIVVVTA